MIQALLFILLTAVLLVGILWTAWDVRDELRRDRIRWSSPRR
ncbi:hypothetical protein [Saccharopolyspora rectivirgula]|jgi:hypothetical protein|nr:hypothetical protein [Saccharopolyspora rectivirgula]